MAVRRPQLFRLPSGELSWQWINAPMFSTIYSWFPTISTWFPGAFHQLVHQKIILGLLVLVSPEDPQTIQDADPWRQIGNFTGDNLSGCRFSGINLIDLECVDRYPFHLDSECLSRMVFKRYICSIRDVKYKHIFLFFM